MKIVIEATDVASSLPEFIVSAPFCIRGSPLSLSDAESASDCSRSRGVKTKCQRRARGPFNSFNGVKLCAARRVESDSREGGGADCVVVTNVEESNRGTDRPHIGVILDPIVEITPSCLLLVHAHAHAREDLMVNRPTLHSAGDHARSVPRVSVSNGTKHDDERLPRGPPRDSTVKRWTPLPLSTLSLFLSLSFSFVLLFWLFPPVRPQ